MPLPLVAIVGRPNVGKSTLFNRIIKRKHAVVDPTPGVTRDRNYAETEWAGLKFTLVDTGGYLPAGEGDELAEAVTTQALIAAEEADLILVIVDSRGGLTDTDHQLASIVRKNDVPTMLIANKVDDATMLGTAWEFTSLGLGNPVTVSGMSGYMVGDMLDVVIRKLKELKPVHPDAPGADDLALAIIGAPNVGKSSLVNRLAGVERSVVSSIPGTTRDSVDAIIGYHGKRIRLIDTAGLRRKRFNEQGLDFYCTLRSLRALDRCEVAVVLIDGEIGFTQGDIRLVNEAAGRGVGVIVAVNKWDLVEKHPKNADEWLEKWQWKVPSLDWAPVLFISALNGRRCIKVIEEALEVKARRAVRVSTSKLNDEIMPFLQQTPPPSVKGKLVKIKYCSQVQSDPPKFAFFVNRSDLIKDAYQRFVEKKLRDTYDLKGVPITVVFRDKNKD